MTIRFRHDSDLEITTGCAAAHPDRRGGQHVAQPCTGVRIRHVPTGVVAYSLDERSQFANRQAALLTLHAELDKQEHDPLGYFLRAWGEYLEGKRRYEDVPIMYPRGDQ